MAESELIHSKAYSKKKVKEILEDYRLARLSREISALGRKEVVSGKAKFGIFGDGKELPQIAMAKQFRKGDFRSGYYRDQTFMLAIGEVTPKQFFAQLYAHPDIQAEPHSGGRQMNAHFATRLLDEEGNWRPQVELKNTAADLSPTAGQMARILGLAQASSIYRSGIPLNGAEKFSDGGKEVVFGTIGDASTSEGIFWETVNAAGVLQVPMVLSVWDDGYGISVPKKYQTTKESISRLLKGFQRTRKEKGLEIITVKGWDYPALVQVYAEAVNLARKEHVPVVVHVDELTQPFGHSTSGSHERYKPEERLAWEEEYCCCRRMREWMLQEGLATDEELDEIEESARKEAYKARQQALKEYQTPILQKRDELLEILDSIVLASGSREVEKIAKELRGKRSVIRKDVVSSARKAARYVRGRRSGSREKLLRWLEEISRANERRYSSHLLSESAKSPLHIGEIPPEYEENAPLVDGRIVLRDNFDKLFELFPEALVFGEDTGVLGGVNLGLEGLQKKYGEIRVADTGIREATILGQGIGLAMRGFRPIAEVQYLDYLLYCFQGMSDDLATLRYRTAGGQAAPVIVRTRGHRLEGIWHSGSPMGMIINGVRGIHVCVPRNLTDAAGFYNTLLRGDDPALVIEPLNAYRRKERVPANLGEFTLPLGVPKIVREGSDITIVSYGPTCTLAESVLPELDEVGISCELIDVRTLLPFDRHQIISESLKKTNRVLFLDEDVPGGASAFMMQQVLDQQGGFRYLDSDPRCLSAKPHRSAFSTDGDYFSKPSADDIFEAVYRIMHEANPRRFPALFE